MIQFPFVVAWAGCARIIVAVCLLLTGFASHGICVEADGASHVASRDHQCCDLAPASQEVPDVGFDTGDSHSLHECAHVPLVQPTLKSAKPDHNPVAPDLLHCLPLHIDSLVPQTNAPGLEPTCCSSSLTPLSTVLRL